MTWLQREACDAALHKLNAMQPPTDEEIIHVERDRIILEVLRTFAPEVAKAAEDAAKRIGFWYA